MSAILSRRELLRRVGLGAAGLVLAACQPKVVEVEKVVTQEVVKEVEKVIKETIVVENEVQAPEPVTGPIEIVGWSVNGMNPDAPEWNDYRETVLAIMEDEMPGVTFTWRDMGWDEVQPEPRHRIAGRHGAGYHRQRELYSALRPQWGISASG